MPAEKKIGTWPSPTRDQYSSSSRHSSCALPRANTGMSTFPPSDTQACTWRRDKGEERGEGREIQPHKLLGHEIDDNTAHWAVPRLALPQVTSFSHPLGVSYRCRTLPRSWTRRSWHPACSPHPYSTPTSLTRSAVSHLAQELALPQPLGVPYSRRISGLGDHHVRAEPGHARGAQAPAMRGLGFRHPPEFIERSQQAHPITL